MIENGDHEYIAEAVKAGVDPARASRVAGFAQSIGTGDTPAEKTASLLQEYPEFLGAQAPEALKGFGGQSKNQAAPSGFREDLRAAMGLS